jgi:hypothetical protein
MQFRSVTFVLAETILRELRAKVTHDPVACDLRDHACRGDTQADTITVDNRRLGKRKRNHRQTIDQDVVGRFEQRFDCQAHGPMTRAQNVDSVDLNGVDNANRPPDLGIRNKLAINLLA